MLADGSPPSAPKLWAAALTDIEVDETVINLYYFNFTITITKILII